MMDALEDYRLFVDLWRFFRENRRGDKDWNRVHEEAASLAARYGNSIFAQKLLLACLDEMEKREAT